MKTNALDDKMQEIQQKYRKLLGFISEESNYEMDASEIIDMISIFWYQYRNVVEFFLQTLSARNNTYFFTGKGSLNLEHNEHLIFSTFGSKNIIDDSLLHFLSNEKVIKSISVSTWEQTSKQIKKILKTNIEILEKYSDTILIIPIRLFMYKDEKTLQDISMKVFLSLFKTSLDNLQDFFNKYESVQSVIADLDPKIKGLLLFSDRDDISEDITLRFEKYVEQESYIGEEFDEISKFYFAVYGLIAQSTDILLIMVSYNIIPFITWRLSYHYIFLLAPTLSELLLDSTEKEKLDFKLKRMTVAYWFYYNFENSKLKDVSYQRYKELIKNLKIEQLIYDDVNKYSLFANVENAHPMPKIIERYLQKIYIEINESKEETS